MPYPLSENGKRAKRYGLSLAGVKYRLANGIPLNAPKQRGNNAKAWETRRVAKDKQLLHHERRGEDMPREVSERVEVRGMAGRVDGVGTHDAGRSQAECDWLEGRIIARNPVNPFAGWGR